AVTDAGLCAEMDDAIEPGCVAQAPEAFRIREVDALEAEAVVELARKPFEPRLLQARIVIIVDVVDADNLVAALQQGASGRRADESCDAGDENSHVAPIGGAVRSAKALQRPYGPQLELRHRPRRDVHRRGRAIERRAAEGREAAVRESRAICG